MADMLMELINSIISAVGSAFVWIIDLFPDSPWKDYSNFAPSGVNLGWVTWLLDFPTWIAHFSLIVTAILVYYAVRVLARWIKFVRN